MKKILIIIALFLVANSAYSITLEECNEMARKNSPLLKEHQINKDINSREIDNLSTNYFPQFSIDAQATYQSEVFELPIKIPGINIPSPDNDQYQSSVSVSQLLWDGGATKNQIEIKQAMLELTNANLETKLFKLKEIVNSLYFNILIIDKNIGIMKQSRETLIANQKQIASMVENGAMLASNRKYLELEITKLNSQIKSIEIDRKTALQSLEYWIGTNINDSEIVAPSTNLPNSFVVKRPELDMLNANKMINNEMKDMANVPTMPKIALFGKFGYGKPNQLNFTKNDWSEYYQVGVKFSWTPFDWFNSNRNVEIAEMNNKSIEYETEEFLRNIEIAAIRDKNEIKKLDELIIDDKSIVEGQRTIVEEKFAELKNGAATASEYVAEQNKLLIAEMNSSINSLKLELNKINLLNKYGN